MLTCNYRSEDPNDQKHDKTQTHRDDDDGTRRQRDDIDENGTTVADTTITTATGTMMGMTETAMARLD